MADDSSNNNPFIDIVVEAGDGIIRLLEKIGLKEPEAQQIIDTLQQKDLLTGIDVRGVWTEDGEIKVAQDTGVTNDQGQSVVRISGPALEALTEAIKNSSATDSPISVDNIAPEAKTVIQAALANDSSNFATEPDSNSTPLSTGNTFQDSEKAPQDISTPQSPGLAFQDSESSAWQSDTQTLGDKLMDYAQGQNAIRDAGISNDLIDAAREGVANYSWEEPKDYSQYAVPDTGATPPEDPNFSSSEEWNDGNDAVYASDSTPEMQATNNRAYEEQVAAQVPYTLDFGAITKDAEREAAEKAQQIVDQTTNQADWDNNGTVIGPTYDLTTHVGQLEKARDIAASTGERLVKLIDANGQWSGSYADADGNEWMHTDANANGVEDHQEAYYANQAAQSGDYGVPLANPDGSWTGMGIRPDGTTYVWENSDGDGMEDHAEQAMYDAANLVPVKDGLDQQVFAEGNPVYYYTSDPTMVDQNSPNYSSTVDSYTTDTTRPPNPGDAANLGAL